MYRYFAKKVACFSSYQYHLRFTMRKELVFIGFFDLLGSKAQFCFGELKHDDRGFHIFPILRFHF